MTFLRRAGIALAAPALAVTFALVVSSLALWVSGNNPWQAYTAMARFSARVDTAISILNRSIPLYLAGLAVAVGFKMGLFNIGVDGQYRIAALLAAAVGAAVALPAPIHVLLIIVVAMAVGAVWAGIAGILKVTRGIHEVISTIMLNAIATGVAAYLLTNYLRDRTGTSLVPRTEAIPPSGRFPSLNPVVEALGFTMPVGSHLHGFLIIAILAGVAFWVLVWRTRFGYDLRASGINPLAARASGVEPGRMVLITMLISGAIAGLVGMSQVLGFFHRYTTDFPAGLGFAGIAVALVGRNHPAGIAIGALLFAYLDRSAQILDLEGIPKEIVQIMQGIIVLSVVVAYEVVRRFTQAQEARAAAAATQATELVVALP